MDLSQTHTTSEGKRLRQSNARAYTGIVGVLISANVPGALCVRMTAPTVRPGSISHTTTRARGSIARAMAIAALCLTTTVDPDAREGVHI